MAFLGWFLQYVIIFIILVAVAGVGIFVGKKLRDRKDAKAAAEVTEEK
ncbi:MAG: vanadium nitrogenase [Roseburia sp.]